MKITTVLSIVAIVAWILLFCIGISEAGWKQKNNVRYVYYNDLNRPMAVVYMDDDRCWKWEVGIDDFQGDHYSGGDRTTTLLDAVNEVERILSYYYHT